MNHTIKLGISTCPNDTFAFHGLLKRCVDWRGLEFDVSLLDVQELNQQLKAGHLDVAKASFHAALSLSGSTVVLPSGSAIGFGVGPLLLSRHAGRLPNDECFRDDQGRRVAVVLCPGAETTAALLFRIFYGDAGLRHVVFSEIMPALQSGQADFGVCIHEGRFTWKETGLFLVEDLGTRWETTTGGPLPLGGILASRDLSHEVLASVQTVIRQSLLYGLAHRDEALVTMRAYAQELDDRVLQAHVDLYVNEQTIDLGTIGRRALDQLFQLAIEAGIVDSRTRPIEVFAAAT